MCCREGPARLALRALLLPAAAEQRGLQRALEAASGLVPLKRDLAQLREEGSLTFLEPQAAAPAGRRGPELPPELADLLSLSRSLREEEPGQRNGAGSRSMDLEKEALAMRAALDAAEAQDRLQQALDELQWERSRRQVRAPREAKPSRALSQGKRTNQDALCLSPNRTRRALDWQEAERRLSEAQGPLTDRAMRSEDALRESEHRQVPVCGGRSKQSRQRRAPVFRTGASCCRRRQRGFVSSSSGLVSSWPCEQPPRSISASLSEQPTARPPPLVARAAGRERNERMESELEIKRLQRRLDRLATEGPAAVATTGSRPLKSLSSLAKGIVSGGSSLRRVLSHRPSTGPSRTSAGSDAPQLPAQTLPSQALPRGGYVLEVPPRGPDPLQEEPGLGSTQPPVFEDHAEEELLEPPRNRRSHRAVRAGPVQEPEPVAPTNPFEEEEADDDDGSNPFR